MDELDEIRQKIDIVSFISEYIPLKKAGRNFKALCPFHSEKTPSFIVSPERQIWHCFGACQTGGDIFTFLMKYENLEFPEALKILAKKAGVTLKRYYQTDASKLKEKIYEINHLASEFYHYLLIKHKVGKNALDYAKSRGISEKSIETFTLGYAPNLWDGLIKFLVEKKGYKIEDLDKAGLVVKSSKSSVSGYKFNYYDRFRGRLMFTLRDHRGNVVGFAGRLLPQEEEKRKEGKYINSPETPVYIKGNVLYGLDVSHEAIKKENKAVIVEGEIDAILSFQAGVSNVVAIKGSALTEGQVNLLKRYTENLILALDMDLAGDSAARRGIEIAENAGLAVKIARLPMGKDPADCVQKSPVFFKKAIKEAVSVFDFLLDSTIKKFDKETAEGKRKIAQDFLNYLSRIDNEIIVSHYLKKLSKEIEVSLEAVSRELAKIKNNQRGQIKKTDSPKILREKNREEVLEEYLIALVIQTKNPQEAIKEIFTLISLEDIKSPATRKILGIIRKFLEKGGKEKDIFSQFPKELTALIDRLYLVDLGKILEEEELFRKELRKTILEIKSLSLKRKIREITQAIKTAANKEEELLSLNKKFKEYTDELKKIEAQYS